MALALVAADLIYPKGRLQPVLFPKETLATIVEAWLSEAETKVADVDAADQDAAATHWVYYRAYSAIAERIAASPSRESFGGNSGGGVESTVDWGQNRADYWEKKAADELAEFESILTPTTTSSLSYHFGLAKSCHRRR
jgi:hypothetical protein